MARGKSLGYKVCDIPEHLKEYAHEITELRLEVTQSQYTSSFNKRTGVKDSVLLGEVEKDYYTEYVGILGELLVRRHYDLDPSYSGYKVSAFVKSSDNVSRDTDLIAYKNGEPIRISIKSGEGSWKANKHSVDKDTADLFVFIMFISNNQYVVLHQTKEQVQGWRVLKGHSEYYYKAKPRKFRK